MFCITHLNEAVDQCSEKQRWGRGCGAGLEMPILCYSAELGPALSRTTNTRTAGVKPAILKKRLFLPWLARLNCLQQILGSRSAEQELGFGSLAGQKLSALGSPPRRGAPAPWQVAGEPTWGPIRNCPAQSCSMFHTASRELLKARCFHKKLHFQSINLSQWRNVPSENIGPVWLLAYSKVQKLIAF